MYIFILTDNELFVLYTIRITHSTVPSFFHSYVPAAFGSDVDIHVSVTVVAPKSSYVSALAEIEGVAAERRKDAEHQMMALCLYSSQL